MNCIIRSRSSGITVLFLVLIFLLVTAATAHGECWFETLCDRYGNCQDVRVCDSTSDASPIPSPEKMYLDTGPIAPIPALPPVGTTHCHQTRRCDSYGCSWEQVCY